MKPCFICNEKKLLTEFYKHSGMKDGHLNKCKECTKVGVRINRRDNLEYYTNYEKHRANQPHRIAARYQYAQTNEGLKAGNRAKAAWSARNPIKQSAIYSAGNAIRDGKIEKASCCEDCGSEGRIHGHHDDYSKPLVVRWLCPPCHNTWHNINGPGINGDEQKLTASG